MHAAYHRGPATSAASSVRYSVPATLPHHLRGYCLHAPPPLWLAPRKQPPPTTAPRASRPSRRQCPCKAGVRKLPLTQLAAFVVCGVRLSHSDVSSSIGARLGASDAAPAAPIKLPARHRRPSARPSQTPPPATAPRATATAHKLQNHQRVAGVRKLPLTARLRPMQAAYHRGIAKSAASSIRDSVPATLPHHLRGYCLHAPPPLGSPLA